MGREAFQTKMFEGRALVRVAGEDPPCGMPMPPRPVFPGALPVTRSAFSRPAFRDSLRGPVCGRLLPVAKPLFSAWRCCGKRPLPQLTARDRPGLLLYCPAKRFNFSRSGARTRPVAGRYRKRRTIFSLLPHGGFSPAFFCGMLPGRHMPAAVRHIVMKKEFPSVYGG